MDPNRSSSIGQIDRTISGQGAEQQRRHEYFGEISGDKGLNCLIRHPGQPLLSNRTSDRLSDTAPQQTLFFVNRTEKMTRN
jgi:hypothetical protein